MHHFTNPIMQAGRLLRPKTSSAAIETLDAPRLQVGIGINTGQCFVGNMGSSQRFNYTAMGDSVNVASRLKRRRKLEGVSLLIGEATAA